MEIPWPRINPAPSAMEAWSLNHRAAREVPVPYQFLREINYYMIQVHCHLGAEDVNKKQFYLRSPKGSMRRWEPYPFFKLKMEAVQT